MRVVGLFDIELFPVAVTTAVAVAVTIATVTVAVAAAAIGATVVVFVAFVARMNSLHGGELVVVCCKVFLARSWCCTCYKVLHVL